MQKKRIEWVDILKGIAIILMMMGHCTNHKYGELSGSIHLWIYSFHMPLFFFLSGVTFSIKKGNYIQFLLSKIKNIVIPMISFNIIQILFECLYYNLLLHNKEYAMHAQLDKFVDIIWGGYLWFLPCLFVAENIFYWLVKLGKKYSYIGTLSVILFTVGCLYVRNIGISLPWKIDTALLIMPFLAMGYTWKNLEKQNLKLNRTKDFVVGLVLLFINIVSAYINYTISKGEYVDLCENKTGNPVLFLLSAIFGILALYYIFRKCSYIWGISYIGKNSIIFYGLNYMSVFLPNIIIYNICHTNFVRMGNMGVIVSIVYALLQCVVSYPIARLINSKFKFVIGRL